MHQNNAFDFIESFFLVNMAAAESTVISVFEARGAGMASATIAAHGGTTLTTTLTKAELAELLFDKVGLNKREAKDMVETFFEEIRDALAGGRGVKLSGFGNFQLRDKPQRPGRNPKTGEEIPISARRVVTFHASQKLKSMVDTHHFVAPADLAPVARTA